MLRKETDRNFIVYPSWAELEAKWEDLPRLFADPLDSGFIEPDFDYRRFGYPDQIQPYKLFDGPVGGGIVLWRGDPHRGRWLPLCILDNGANMREPNGVRGFSALTTHDPTVCFLEPYDDPMLRLLSGKKPRIYDPGLSYEHAESASDTVHWVVRYKRPKRTKHEIGGLTELSDIARPFGVELHRSTEVPTALLNEVAPWFTNPEFESTWFTAKCADSGVGYQFAIEAYVGNYLRSLAGPAMESMHLVAQIEGRPNHRHRWNRKN